MKQYLLLFIITLTSFSISAQSPKKGYGEPVKQIEPQYKGGEDSLKAYIARTLRFPREAAEKKEEGRVYIGFTVDRTGKIKEVNVLNGVSATLDQEAMRIVQQMPDWEPGTIGGTPVDRQFILPVDFILPKGDSE